MSNPFLPEKKYTKNTKYHVRNVINNYFSQTRVIISYCSERAREENTPIHASHAKRKRRERDCSSITTALYVVYDTRVVGDVRRTCTSWPAVIDYRTRRVIVFRPTADSEKTPQL